MSKPIFWETLEKYFNMSSAENFTQNTNISATVSKNLYPVRILQAQISYL